MAEGWDYQKLPISTNLETYTQMTAIAVLSSDVAHESGLLWYCYETQSGRRMKDSDRGKIDAASYIARNTQQLRRPRARRTGNLILCPAGAVVAAPVLHLYAQPEDPGYLQAQQSIGATHSWFRVRKIRST